MSRINQLSPCRQSISICLVLDFRQLSESRFITLVYRHLEDKLKRYAEYWQLKSNPESSSAFKCKALSAIDEVFGSKTWPDNEVIGAAVNHRPVGVINVQIDSVARRHDGTVCGNRTFFRADL
jgi:hypothetical protein